MPERCHKSVHVEGGANRQCLLPSGHSSKRDCEFAPAACEVMKRAALRDELSAVAGYVAARVVGIADGAVRTSDATKRKDPIANMKRLYAIEADRATARALSQVHDWLLARREAIR